MGSAFRLTTFKELEDGDNHDKVYNVAHLYKIYKHMHRVFNILRKRHCSTSKQYITYVPTTHKPTLLSHEHSKKETLCMSYHFKP